MSLNESDYSQRFTNTFTPIMHFFHSVALEASKEAEFSLPQYRMLMLLLHKGAMGVPELRQELGIAQSSVSEMAEKLVQQNLLIREKDDKDRRRTIFHLTSKAMKLLEERKNAITHCCESILKPLAPDEQKQFVEAFELIHAFIQKIKLLRFKVQSFPVQD